MEQVRERASEQPCGLHTLRKRCRAVRSFLNALSSICSHRCAPARESEARDRRSTYGRAIEIVKHTFAARCECARFPSCAPSMLPSGRLCVHYSRVCACVALRITSRGRRRRQRRSATRICTPRKSVARRCQSCRLLFVCFYAHY